MVADVMTLHEGLNYLGLCGALVYLVSYFLLQAGYIGGNSKPYISLNVVAATLVLLSLYASFNAASAIIQTSWILISLFGALRMYLMHRRIRFTEEEQDFVDRQLSELPRHLARKFLDIGIWIDGPRGAELTRQGVANGRLIYLKDGLAEVIVNAKQVATCRPGSFVGEMTVLSNEPATATVRLTTNARLFSIDCEAMRALARNEASVASVIQTSFSHDMRLKLQATSQHVGIRTLTANEQVQP